VKKKDPYAALRIKEFNIFLLVRFALVFGWSMQFIVIEWKVYELTGDPLYLGLIGLMEIIPALSMALFAGHIVDQKEKRNLLALCIAAFSLISFGLFWVTSAAISNTLSKQTILYIIYAFVFFWWFSSSIFWTNYFFLSGINSSKKNIPKCSNME